MAAGSDWQRAEDQGKTMLFCPIQFDTLLLDSPIARSDLKADPRFERSRILTQPWAGSPFLVTDEEWQAIADRLPRRFTVATDGAVTDLRATRAHSSADQARAAANVWKEVPHPAPTNENPECWECKCDPEVVWTAVWRILTPEQVRQKSHV